MNKMLKFTDLKQEESWFKNLELNKRSIKICFFGTIGRFFDLELIIKEDCDNQSANEKTDIFTWALFKNNAKREILIDYDTNAIIKCIFKTGSIKMTAKNIQYINK